MTAISTADATTAHYIYSDASFHPQSKTGVCGILIDEKIHYQIHGQTTNIDMERQAFEMAKEFLGSDQKVYVFVTDCHKVFQEGIKAGLQMMQVPGHKPASQRNPIEQKFSILDRALRKQLRLLLRSSPSITNKTSAPVQGSKPNAATPGTLLPAGAAKPMARHL
jgi:hypothetical protein